MLGNAGSKDEKASFKVETHRHNAYFWNIFFLFFYKMHICNSYVNSNKTFLS